MTSILKKTVFLASLSLTGFSACKEQLNVLPTTSIVDGNLITDSLSAMNALNGVYYRFANVAQDFNGLNAIKWSHMFEIYPSELAGTVRMSSFDDEYSEFTFTENSSYPLSLWGYGYALANAANGFIQNMDAVTTISPAGKQRMLAESYFLRAFAYETLLLNFGEYTDINSKYGVILRTEPTSASTLNMPRASVAACYQQIIEDLDFAITHLPETGRAKTYASKAAAQLLKARVLLNRATTGDLQQVISLTDAVMKQPIFSLEPKLSDLFLQKGLSSSEVILGITPYPNQSWKFYFYNQIGTYSVSKTAEVLFDDDDRKNWFFKDDQNGTVYGKNYGGIREFTKYYNGPVVGPTQTATCEVSYAFRLTAAYLYKAEALASLGQDLQTAKDLLKEVLSKSGVSDFAAIDHANDSTTLKSLIIQEHIKNFMGENGDDWYALRRLPIEQIKTIQPKLTVKERFILPIPYSERSHNNLIDQNLGY